MSTESNPGSRERPEARITALLLGELSPEEAAETQQVLLADPELAALHRRLERTISLVRAATAEAASPDVAPAMPLQLPHDKRQQIFQRFKTKTLRSAPLPARGLPWQAQLSMAATLVAFIGLVAVAPGMWSGTGAKSKGTHLSPVARQKQVSAAADLPDLKAAISEPESGETIVAFSATDKESKPTASVQSRPELGTVVTVASADNHWAFGGGGSRNAPGPDGGIPGVPTLGDKPTFGLYFKDSVKPTELDALSVQPVTRGFADFDATGFEDSLERAPAAGAIGAQGGSSPLLIAGRKLERYGLMPSQSEALLKQKKDVAQVAEQDTKAEGVRQLAEAREEIRRSKVELSLKRGLAVKLREENEAERMPPATAPPAPVPQPEFQTSETAFSTFSLNVTDVSFKLAAATLEKGILPAPGAIRSEEFINAFDYHDPRPSGGQAVSFVWERARDPFTQDRDVLRLAVGTAARGQTAGRALNLVIVLDRSGSMERSDRVRTVQEALKLLAGQLGARDTVSVITFARTAHLFAEGISGTNAAATLEQAAAIPPEGGTNLEDALGLAYSTALRRHAADRVSRVVLLTDGAANLGNVNSDALQRTVQAHRQQGVALDCFGIGWEGFNDDLLQILSSRGDGRYGFLNTPEEARANFAGQLAGALNVAAADVKVQVEFNPKRVTAFRQVGYAKHQLTAAQFRDNTVDAAELGAAESGNALYLVQVNSQGDGPLAQVRVRYKKPGTSEYQEQQWPVPYTGEASALDRATPSLRLAATAAAFSEWLMANPFAAEVTPDRLLNLLSGVPEAFASDPRPKQLESMIRQAKSLR